MTRQDAAVLYFLGAGATVMLMVWGRRQYLRWRLRGPVERAYALLRDACEPQTLHPEHPGNPDHIKAAARDFSNPLGRRLARAGFFCPDKCTKDEDSLLVWFKYLEDVRMNLGPW